MAKKKKNDIAEASLLYYGGRLAQRISLLVAALLTFSLWAVIISYAVSSLSYGPNADPDLTMNISATIDTTVDRLSLLAGTWAVVALGLTVLLAFLPRVRKFEKRLVADGVVISVFLFLAVVCAQSAVRAFITNYLS